METLLTPQSASSDQSRPDVRTHVVALLDYATSNPLDTEGAWRPASKTCRSLTQHTDTTPPGGWAALTGLCAGPFLEATKTHFELSGAVDIPDEPGLRAMLINTFTRRLIPPNAAAGLFLMLGIHPAWGLRIAHQFTGGDAEVLTGSSWQDPDIFPRETFDVLTATTFGFVADIIGQLRSLEPWTRYPVDELAELIRELAVKGRTNAERRCTTTGGVPPLVAKHDLSNHRTRDYVCSDLLDSVLTPAGAVRTFEDRTFCLMPDALDGVDVPESTKRSAA